MKRSEMAALLTTFYNQNLADVEGINTDEAERIIDFLEKNGMLPPDLGTGPIVGTNYSSCSTDYSKLPTYEWEKE